VAGEKRGDKVFSSVPKKGFILFKKDECAEFTEGVKYVFNGRSEVVFNKPTCIRFRKDT